MSQSLCQNHVHIIFHINFVNPVKIPSEIERDLYAYLAEICKRHGSNSSMINGVNDHVHILCRLGKDLSIAELIQKLKSNSSRWLKTQNHIDPFLEKFSWQKGYGSFSVSPSNLSKVEQYIAHQREHHKRYSYKEEYLKFLEKYDVEYNEKYLWE